VGASAVKYLVIRLAGIGDVVMASTVIAKLRADDPGAHVTWLTGEVPAPLVRLFDGVDDVITVNEHRLLRGGVFDRAASLLGLWSTLLRRRFDRVILLHVDRRYRALVAPLVRTPVLALSRAKHGDMNPVPGRYLGDEYARLLDGLGHVGPLVRKYDIADVRPNLARSASSETSKVAIVPGGARNVLRESALRRWPIENYVAVARELAQSGHEIILIGDKHDDWIRPYFAGVPVTDMVGALDLPATLSALAGSRLVISHDTGPMHLARLVRAPLVALFGPTMPAQFIAPDGATEVLWGGGHLACRPCYDGRDFARCSDNICMSSITPAEVLRAATARLAASR
jgi:heptosyltransferase II